MGGDLDGNQQDCCFAFRSPFRDGGRGDDADVPLADETAHDSVGEGPVHMWVVRHGERADDETLHHPSSWLKKAREESEKNNGNTPDSGSLYRLHDPPLTDNGRKQARKVGEDIQSSIREIGLRDVYVLSSPFSRCAQTAVEVCSSLGSKKVAIEPGLSEWLNGKWFDEDPIDEAMKHCEDVKKSKVEVDENYQPVLSYEDLTFPETVTAGLNRYNTVLSKVLDHFKGMSRHKAGIAVIVVTHGHALGHAVTMVEEDKVLFEVPYCGVVKVTLKDDTLTLNESPLLV